MNALRLPGSAREASFSLLSRLLLLSPLFFLGQDAMALDIFMHINGTAHRVVLEENDAARDFAARLPLTLTFEDYAATERISYLERKLTLGASPRSTTPKKGDFTYYSPWGNIAVFMKPFRHSEGLVPPGTHGRSGARSPQRLGRPAGRIPARRVALGAAHGVRSSLPHGAL